MCESTACGSPVKQKSFYKEAVNNSDSPDLIRDLNQYKENAEQGSPTIKIRSKTPTHNRTSSAMRSAARKREFQKNADSATQR